MRPDAWSLWACCVISLVLLLGQTPGCTAVEGKTWVLLVAGARDYGNYGIQSDVCHAYQVFASHGIPDEQIVVMMYDDIAYNELNPFQGNIINEFDGPNVYPGVPHDYVGEDVVADVVLAVLQGDRDKVFELTGFHGKVIDSGPDDRVFVYFDSHGGPGMFGVHSTILYASELQDALESMHENNRFEKLVFYIDCCYAGSMFEDLKDDIDIYTVTSCDSISCSYFAFFDEVRKAYLGSFYVYAWLHNCETVDLRTETLEEQFEIIVRDTEFSVPQQYGDLSFTHLPVGDFMGLGKNLPRFKKQIPNKDHDILVPRNEAEVFILKQMLADPREASRHEEIRAELEEKLWLQAQTDVFMSNVARAAFPNRDIDWALNTQPTIKQRSAYEYAVGHLMDVCPRLGPGKNTYVMSRLHVLVNLSNTISLRKVLAAVDVAASDSPLCV